MCHVMEINGWTTLALCCLLCHKEHLDYEINGNCSGCWEIWGVMISILVHKRGYNDIKHKTCFHIMWAKRDVENLRLYSYDLCEIMRNWWFKIYTNNILIEKKSNQNQQLGIKRNINSIYIDTGTNQYAMLCLIPNRSIPSTYLFEVLLEIKM